MILFLDEEGKKALWSHAIFSTEYRQTPSFATVLYGESVSVIKSLNQIIADLSVPEARDCDPVWIR